MLIWSLVSIALIGTVLNLRKDRRCFWFWSLSNAGLLAVNAKAGQWAQASLFSVYLLLALWGLVSWRE
jgi:nicotinamide riboside transporter PnuC